MSAGTEIIQEALEQIGAYSVASAPMPESIETGRKVLNSMLQMWETKKIYLDIIPLQVAGDELSEPLDARQGIIDNLSLALAPKFDNGKIVVSQDLRRNARILFNDIKKHYQDKTIPDKKVSSNMPMGQGNKNRTYSETFAGTDHTITNP